MRLAWFAAVAFVAIFSGSGRSPTWLDSLETPGWWAIDLQLVLDAGARLLAGSPLYSDPKFLTRRSRRWSRRRSLSGLDALPVSLTYAALKVGVAVAAVAWVDPGLGAPRSSPGARRPAHLPAVPARPVAGQRQRMARCGDRLGGLRDRRDPLTGIALGVGGRRLREAVPAPDLSVAAGRAAAGPRRGGGRRARGDGRRAPLLAGPSAYVAWVAGAVRRRRALRVAVRRQPRRQRPGARPLGARRRRHGRGVPRRPRARQPSSVARVGRHLRDPHRAVRGHLLRPPGPPALPVLGPALPVFTLLVVGLSPVATAYPLPIYAAAILLGALAIRGPEPPGWSLRTP